MRKIHTIHLSADERKLLLFALGFTEGAFRASCQLEVCDALILLTQRVKKQTKDLNADAVKTAKTA